MRRLLHGFINCLTSAPSCNYSSNPVLTALGRHPQAHAAGCFGAAIAEFTPDSSTIKCNPPSCSSIALIIAIPLGRPSKWPTGKRQPVAPPARSDAVSTMDPGPGLAGASLALSMVGRVRGHYQHVRRSRVLASSDSAVAQRGMAANREVRSQRSLRLGPD